MYSIPLWLPVFVALVAYIFALRRHFIQKKREAFENFISITIDFLKNGKKDTQNYIDDTRKIIIPYYRTKTISLLNEASITDYENIVKRMYKEIYLTEYIFGQYQRINNILKTYEKLSSEQKDVEEEASSYKYHIINTNYNNDKNIHSWILKNKVAAAFYSPQKEKINKIKNGDYVFLYQSGAGIVAFGQATYNNTLPKKNKLIKHIPEHEIRCTHLNPFYKIKPFSAKQIKDTLGYSIWLANTHSPIYENGEKLYKKLNELTKKTNKI
jgi:hypothetical protein